MSGFGGTLAIAGLTAGLALLGGNVATSLTTYGAVSNETASIYTYENALLESGAGFTNDLSSLPLTASNQRTVLATADAYAVVIQIPTGQIYLSTSTNPNPMQVESSAEVTALPLGVDVSVVASAIDGYAAEHESSQSDLQRFTGDVIATVGDWLAEHAPTQNFPS